MCKKVQSRGPGSGDPTSKARSDPAACEKKKGFERGAGWLGGGTRTHTVVGGGYLKIPESLLEGLLEVREAGVRLHSDDHAGHHCSGLNLAYQERPHSSLNPNPAPPPAPCSFFLVSSRNDIRPSVKGKSGILGLGKRRTLV